MDDSDLDSHTEFWVSGEQSDYDEDGFAVYTPKVEDATGFTLELTPEDESGGEHLLFDRHNNWLAGADYQLEASTPAANKPSGRRQPSSTGVGRRGRPSTSALLPKPSSMVRWTRLQKPAPPS